MLSSQYFTERTLIVRLSRNIWCSYFSLLSPSSVLSESSSSKTRYSEFKSSSEYSPFFTLKTLFLGHFFKTKFKKKTLRIWGVPPPFTDGVHEKVFGTFRYRDDFGSQNAAESKPNQCNFMLLI